MRVKEGPTMSENQQSLPPVAGSSTEEFVDLMFGSPPWEEE